MGTHSRSVIWFGLILAYLIASFTNNPGYATGIAVLMLCVISFLQGYKWLSTLSLALPAGAYYFWPDNSMLIAYLPPLCAFLFMASFFFYTLTGRREALIARIARKEHPNLPPEIAEYCRILTWIWVITFLGLFVSSTALALLQPLDKWSHWVYGLGYLIPALLFFGEYLYRHYKFRHIKHQSIMALVINTIVVIKEMTQARQIVNKTQPQQ